ncbi:MAG: AsmA-like C-terminal region-containing protein [Flavobacteriales bacterium]
MLRMLRNAVLALAALFVLGFGTLVVLAHVYEDEVKAKLIGAVNAELATPVSVSGMDLTLVARFPQASMRLNDVLAMEVRSDDAKPDTLLYAKELFLEFSLWDLFSGDYTVQEIHATQARLYPGLDTKGRGNYIVWKTDSTRTGSSPINLDKVSFNDLHVRYHDDRSALIINTHSDALALSGRFDEALNTLNLNGDAHLLSWMDGGTSVLTDRKAYLKLKMEFGAPDALFRIIAGEVVSGSVPLEVSLAVTEEQAGTAVDLRATGLGLDLEDAVELLPEGLKQALAGYTMKGEVDLAVHYTGPVSGPSLSLGAKVTKGRLKEQRSGTVVSDVFGELALDLSPQGVPRKLVVKNFSARSGGGTVSGTWQSNGLTNATVKADLRSDIALADLLRFAQVDTLEQVSGRLSADLHIRGRLRDMADIRAVDLRALNVNGTLAARDATLKLKGVRHTIQQLDADLAIHGNDATVQGLKAMLQGNELVLSGTLRNLIPYLLFDDQRLVIEARGSSPRIDLAALVSSGSADAESKDYRLTLPSTIELDLQAQVDELVFEEFRATDIRGTMSMKGSILRVDPMTFGTASGTVRGALELDARDAARSYPLAINASLDGIELQQLFREFQDFGQDFIGHRHISGRTKAQVAFNAPLSPAMKLDMDRLVCVIDIGVDNGVIKGHAPMLEVADHLQKNKLVAPFVDVPELRRRLGDIRFARLENQIEIRNGAVHIPQMLVSSSVMDIELSGTHWFDDRIDHHLNFRLSDLFRKGSADDEFGPVVDDGTGMRLFLHMYGTANDPQFGNDGAMAAAKRKKQFQEEKQELKQILREELGLFKGKTRPADPAAKVVDPAAPRFEVEEQGLDTNPTAGAQGSQPRQRKGLGRLMKDQQEEEEVIFEVE